MSLCDCIRGIILLDGGGSPIPMAGVTVHLWTGDRLHGASRAEATSDENGHFSLDTSTMSGSQGGSVRAWKKGVELTLHGDTNWSLTRGDRELVICAAPVEVCTPPEDAVPDITPPMGESGDPSLWGQVRHSDGTPAFGVAVELWSIAILTADTAPTASYTSNGSGYYGFWGALPPGLILKAKDGAGHLIASSNARYGATSGIRIDLITCDERYRTSCEFSRIDTALLGLISVGDIPSINVRAVAVLSGHTGWGIDQITVWVLAYRFAASIASGASYLPEQLYGLMREGFPRVRDSILVRSSASVTLTLQRAARQNIISHTAIDTTYSPNPLFHTALTALHLGTRADAIGAILRTSGVLGEDQVASFITLYLSFTGTDAAFWDALADESYFTEVLAEEAHRLWTLGTLALCWAPAVAQILTVIGSADASAIATISAAQWHTIAAGTSPLPDGLTGDTTPEQINDLARLLALHAELAFPSETALVQLRAIGVSGPVETWFSTGTHATFDLARDRAEVIDPSINTDVLDEIRTLQRLYRISPSANRATSMAALSAGGVSSARQVAVMGTERFNAKFATTLGADGALEAFKKARSLSAMATTFYAQAHPNLSLAGLSFLPRYAPDESGYVDPASLPDWATLFGSQSYCACEECRSIIGPTAYYVDLLHWLDGKELGDGSGQTALDFLIGTTSSVVFARRPDLGTLGLNCENAMRALPYIDLTLEILETAAQGATLVSHETTASGVELLAAPEYPSAAAYTTLGTAKRSIRLPFHQPAEEMRVFLSFLGVHRPDLMRAFKTTAGLSDAQIAVEELRLSVEGRAAIHDASTSNSEENLYWPETVAVTATTQTVTVFRRAAELEFADILDLLHTRFVNARTRPTDPGTAISIAYTDVNDISTYVLSAGGSSTFNYATVAPLRRFLRLKRVTGWPTLELDKVLFGLGATSGAIEADTGALFTEMGDIQRLVHRTGLEPVEIASWKSSVALDVWEDRASKNAPILSYYARRLLTPALFDAEGRTTGPFAVNWTPASSPSPELYGEADPLEDWLPTLQGMLGVDSDDLAVLIAKVGLTTASLLTLAHVSALYRWISIARAAKLDPSDATYLATLSGIDPTISYANAIAFLDEAQEITAAGWSVDDLRYVVEHEASERVAPTDSWCQQTLGKVRDALAATYQGLTPAATDTGMVDSVVKVLAEAFEVDRAVLDEWRSRGATTAWSHLPWMSTETSAVQTFIFATKADVNITSTSSTSYTAPIGMQVRIPIGVAVTGTPHSGGSPVTVNLSDDCIATLTTAPLSLSLSSGTTFSVALAGTRFSWTPGGSTVSVAVRYAPGTVSIAVAFDVSVGAAGLTVVSGSTTYIFDAGATLTVAPASITLLQDVDITVETGASALWSATGFLYTDLLLRFLRTAFWETSSTDASSPWADLTRTAFPNDFMAIDLLAKAILTVKKLTLDSDERGFWYDHVGTGDWGLPAIGSVSTDSSGISYAGLKHLIDLFALRTRLPGTSPTYAELLASIANGEVEDSVRWALPGFLADRTGWNEDDLRTLINAASPYPSASMTGLDSADAISILLDQLSIVRRVGKDAASVAAWAVEASVSALTNDLSAEVVAAARSRYADASAWAPAAQPIRDHLRKIQRDALVSYLIPVVNAGRTEDTKIRDADGLYQYYYIDVSMNPEMLTSRIVQGYCTIQLFVHRCMFGLETTLDTYGDVVPLVSFNDHDRRMWEWMRTFRVWQAARKVFLYPENWILPELRDDKTPFYKRFEQDIAQGDIVADRVEQGMLDYLDQLHDVASLEVLAYHVQKETVDDEVLDNVHVIARSRGTPPVYWYRRRENSATWTPWEKVEGGVSGDHLLVTVYNRRLLLLWLEFSEAMMQSGDETSYPTWDIRLYWSEYRDGKWRGKNGSEEKLNADRGDPNGAWLQYPALQDVMLTGNSDGDDFVADVAIRLEVQGQLDQYAIGSFRLDACTMEISVTVIKDYTDVRQGVNGVGWLNPGFHTHDSINDPGTDYFGNSYVKTLDLYCGESDDPDEPGDATGLQPLTVLEQFVDGTAVFSGQWKDYVSQGPFFINWKDRAYFVEVARSSKIVGSYQQMGSSRESTCIDNLDEEESDPADITDAMDYSEIALLSTPRTNMTAAATVDALRSADYALRTSDWDFTLSSVVSGYRFTPFYHPYVCDFIKEVRRNGVFSLLNPSSDPDATAWPLFRQQISSEDEAPDDFLETFQPTDAVTLPYPIEEVDFGDSGAYSNYNWEVFFHIPLYVAQRLTENRQFDDAFNWYHAIFDPRTPEAVPDGCPQNAKWWRIKPFLEDVSAPVTDWLAFTGTGGSTDATAAFEKQVAAWQEDPFNPHQLARLRPGTYQKTLVMSYLDSLLAWGDALFSKDTIESINEATMLYVYAKQILGDRPEKLDPVAEVPVSTFADLRGTLDAWSNATVVLENAYVGEVSGDGTSDAGASATTSVGYGPYFCVPQNEKLMGYWETVADRLFKIRNGMNIEGLRRSLALFEPPIDPALLVRAAAAGIDIGSVLSGSGISRPNYRFSVMLGRAQGLAGSVRALGQALLSAMEKQDAEGLAQLRQGHELDILDQVRLNKEKAIEEALANLDAAKQSKVLTNARKTYYKGLIDKKWIGEEIAAAALTAVASVAEITGGILQSLTAEVAPFPDAYGGLPFHTGSLTGGGHMARITKAHVDRFGIIAGSARGAAAYLSTAAVYKRRAQEWNFQLAQAEKELTQIDKQIAAAQIRYEMATQDLKNHDLQREQSEQVRDWMTSKFTNAELYQWSVSQLAALYFQTYQLAVLTANKAQQAYQWEIGDRTATFIQASYWDNQRKGLLAGERLTADLERMDTAYLDNDVREFELVRHVSLARLDPVALQMLTSGGDGECWFEVPEALFDADCPGHYLRRVQSVAISIACVGGMNTTVNAQLTLYQHAIRASTAATLTWTDSTSSIVTSAAVNDAGLFSADPRDPRYLPFERCGAVSRWHLRLTAQTWKQLDWESIADVTLHLRYTARDGGETYRNTVAAALAMQLKTTAIGFTSNAFTSPLTSGTGVAFSAKRDASDAFYEAQNGAAVSGYKSFVLDLDETMLPDIAAYTYTRVMVILVSSATVTVDGTSASTSTSGTWSGLPYSLHTFSSITSTSTIDISLSSTVMESLSDILIVLLPTAP